jgi:hypothetical protein
MISSENKIISQLTEKQSHPIYLYTKFVQCSTPAVYEGINTFVKYLHKSRLSMCVLFVKLVPCFSFRRATLYPGRRHCFVCTPHLSPDIGPHPSFAAKVLATWMKNCLRGRLFRLPGYRKITHMFRTNFFEQILILILFRSINNTKNLSPGDLTWVLCLMLWQHPW